MRWAKGRAEIDRLITEGRLQKVPPSRAHADRLLGQALRHLDSARLAAAGDPEGAYALLYDGARKALWAVLENQGLRPTTAGGHLAAQNAVLAQLVPPLGEVLKPFDRLRRRRASVEYPSGDIDDLAAEDVYEDLPKVRAILAVAERVLDEMSVY